ncbi:MAG: lysozyme [Halomonas sp.]|nr:lysozyme [Halomonas sp.]
MQLSPDGLELIQRHEGLRLHAYRDAVGVPTIGYGHTSTARMGQVITELEALELLLADVERFENAVERLVQVPLNQHQFDSLVSFTFNLGAGALAKSTLLRKLNAGDYQGAAAEFDHWVHAGGRKLKGLVKRRADERRLFETPTHKPFHWLDEVEKRDM